MICLEETRRNSVSFWKVITFQCHSNYFRSFSTKKKTTTKFVRCMKHWTHCNWTCASLWRILVDTVLNLEKKLIKKRTNKETNKKKKGNTRSWRIKKKTVKPREKRSAVNIFIDDSHFALIAPLSPLQWIDRFGLHAHFLSWAGLNCCFSDSVKILLMYWYT